MYIYIWTVQIYFSHRLFYSECTSHPYFNSSKRLLTWYFCLNTSTYVCTTRLVLDARVCSGTMLYLCSIRDHAFRTSCKCLARNQQSSGDLSRNLDHKSNRIESIQELNTLPDLTNTCSTCSQPGTRRLQQQHHTRNQQESSHCTAEDTIQHTPTNIHTSMHTYITCRIVLLSGSNTLTLLYSLYRTVIFCFVSDILIYISNKNSLRKKKYLHHTAL